jgi:hypothetical protein
MSLYVEGDKVHFKSDDGLWYKFGLQRIDNVIYRTEWELADDPGPGYDESAVLPLGDEKYKVFAITRPEDGLVYLDYEQLPTAEPLTDPIILSVNSIDYRLIMVDGPGGVYLDYEAEITFTDAVEPFTVDVLSDLFDVEVIVA